MKINSHIQLPKFIIRKFEDEKHFVHYIDIENACVLKTGHADSLNTKEDYYSLEIEKYLQRELESPFSRLLHQFENVDFDKATLAFNIDDDRLAK